jgi:hypothetical protein
MPTVNLEANEWKKLGSARLRGRTIKVTVKTSKRCWWDKRPGTSGSFTKTKTSNLLLQSFWVKSPVDTKCTYTWIEQW